MQTQITPEAAREATDPQALDNVGLKVAGTIAGNVTRTALRNGYGVIRSFGRRRNPKAQELSHIVHADDGKLPTPENARDERGRETTQ